MDMQTLTQMALAFELAEQGVATRRLRHIIDRDGMVEEPIENRRGNDGIPEHLAPGAEALIAGEQNRALLIAPSMFTKPETV